MIGRILGIAAAVMTALTARAAADSCDDLRNEIKRLTLQQKQQQDALDRCRLHPVGCSVRDLADGLAQTSQEIAAESQRLLTCSPLPHPAPRFRITDMSPTAAHRSVSDGNDPGGRMLTVVVDPTNPTTLYAASEFAGVWKQVDAIHGWSQASVGLTFSELAEPGGDTPALAIDETHPGHLVLAAGHDDDRAGPAPGVPGPHSSYGIWYTLDAAATWYHAKVAGHASCSATRVAFGGGHGYAVTSCGLAGAGADLATWTVLPAPFTVSTSSTHVAARGQQVLACDGNTIRVGTWSAPVRTPSGLQQTLQWGATATLGGACQGLAAAPSAGAPLALAIYQDSQSSLLEVATIQFTSAPAPKTMSFARKLVGANTAGVYVAPRRGDLVVPYDVFASDGYVFSQYVPPAAGKPESWQEIGGMHHDTWSMAFPATYEPRNGNCTAYAANDGGISISAAPTPGRACRTAARPWQRAQSGLRGLGSDGIVGVHGRCGTPPRDCFGLYVSAPDNGTWGMRSGGAASAWASMACCGDSGMAAADWAAPWRVVAGRNGGRVLWDGKDQPPTGATPQVELARLFPAALWRPNPDPAVPDKVPPELPDLGEPPQQATFSQVQTLSRELAANPRASAIVNGDYLQVITLPAGDTVYRMTDGRTWSDIAPGKPFVAGKLRALASGGGHAATVVYAIDDSSKLWRFDLAAASGWQVASGAPCPSPRPPAGCPDPLHAIGDVWVNPDNAQQLYVTELPDASRAGGIRYSVDGGAHWNDDAALTLLASQHGEFKVGCFGPERAGRRMCTLQQMLWLRDRADFRVAILYPGGVAITRDGGASWRMIDSFSLGALPIHSLRDLIAHPYGGYLDAGPGDTFQLYLAMHGRGVVRIDGSF